MAQEITTFSAAALPALDTADPASMLLLPAWLASQIAAVSDLGAGRTEVDRATGQITKRIATIPVSKMPNGRQRMAIAHRIDELQVAIEPGPTVELLAALGELIREYAPARLDDRTVSTKAEAYLDALEDLPAWTVREAIRRWRRGDVEVESATLDFAPRPARLRSIAGRLVLVAQGQAARLQRILDAQPERPLTDEEMAANHEEMRKLVAETVSEAAAEQTFGASPDRQAALADLEQRRLRREAAERGLQPGDRAEAAAEGES